MSNDFCKRSSDSFTDFHNEHLNEMIKRRLAKIEIWGESTYFGLTIPFFHSNLTYYAVVIGDRDGTNVKVFLPTVGIINIVKKITFSIEMIFEVFRTVHETKTHQSSIAYELYS